MHVVLHKYAALHKSLRTRYRCSGIVQRKKKECMPFWTLLSCSKNECLFGPQALSRVLVPGTVLLLPHTHTHNRERERQRERERERERELYYEFHSLWPCQSCAVFILSAIKRDIGVDWYLFSNLCTRKCIHTKSDQLFILSGMKSILARMNAHYRVPQYPSTQYPIGRCAHLLSVIRYRQSMHPPPPVLYTRVARWRSESTSQFTVVALNKHSSSSPRTCTAGTVAFTPARCSLAEVDTTLLKQYRSQEG